MLEVAFDLIYFTFLCFVCVCDYEVRYFLDFFFLNEFVPVFPFGENGLAAVSLFI